MKQILTLFLIALFVNAYSQDIIVKKNGEELQTRVLDVKEGQIFYTKYHSKSDSTFSIATTDVVMIKYENGIEFVYNPAKSTYYASLYKEPNAAKKGLFLGASFALGSGGIFDWLHFHTASNLGADLGYFFNSFVGLKTGLYYMTLPYGAHNEYSTSVVGVPTMLVFSIGDKFGFYSETGAVFYFQSGNNDQPFIAVENLIGIHGGSDRVDLKLGLLLNTTVKGYAKEFDSGSFFLGINAGVCVYL